MTHLAVSIFVDSLSQAHAAAAQAAEHGANLVEYRIDHFTEDTDAAIQLVKNSAEPPPVPIPMLNPVASHSPVYKSTGPSNGSASGE